MAYPQTGAIVPMGLPHLGQNSKDPLGAMDSAYSPYTLNMEPEPQFLKVRKGLVRHCAIPDSYIPTRLCATADKLFAVCYKAASDNRIYDITNGAAISDVTPAHYTGKGTNGILSSFEFAGRVALLGINPYASVFYNGSVWAAFPLTSGGAQIDARVGCSHKGRVYLGTSPSTLYYGELAQVISPPDLTTWDLSTIFRRNGDVNVLASLSPPTNKLDDQMLVIGTSAGEVLVYAGDYPGATNWQVVGHFEIPELRGYNPFLSFNNDIWLITKVGIVSVRALFENSASNMEAISPSFPVNPDITKLQAKCDATGRGLHTSLAYWEDRNLVYLAMNGVYDPGTDAATGGISFWIYNIISRAWTFAKAARQDGGKSFLYFRPHNAIYFPGDSPVLGESAIYKTSLSAFYDQDRNGINLAYDYALHSAYSDVGRAGRKKISGFEPLIKTDFTGANVTMASSVDFGRKVSAATSNALLAAGGYQRPLYLVGTNGEFVQYRIAGEADAASVTGLEVYSVGAILS